MDAGLLLGGWCSGWLMAAHGAQKLFGWFGGYGLAGTGGFFEQLGFRPGRLFATVAAVTEIAERTAGRRRVARPDRPGADAFGDDRRARPCTGRTGCSRRTTASRCRCSTRRPPSALALTGTAPTRSMRCWA